MIRKPWHVLFMTHDTPHDTLITTLLMTRDTHDTRNFSWHATLMTHGIPHDTWHFSWHTALLMTHSSRHMTVLITRDTPNDTRNFYRHTSHDTTHDFLTTAHDTRRFAAKPYRVGAANDLRQQAFRERGGGVFCFYGFLMFFIGFVFF